MRVKHPHNVYFVTDVVWFLYICILARKIIWAKSHESGIKGAVRFGTLKSIDFKKKWYVKVPVVPRSLML